MPAMCFSTSLASRWRKTSLICWRVIFGLRPISTRRAPAQARPSPFLARISSYANSANLPSPSTSIAHGLWTRPPMCLRAVGTRSFAEHRLGSSSGTLSDPRIHRSPRLVRSRIASGRGHFIATRWVRVSRPEAPPAKPPGTPPTSHPDAHGERDQIRPHLRRPDGAAKREYTPVDPPAARQREDSRLGSR